MFFLGQSGSKTQGLDSACDGEIIQWSCKKSGFDAPFQFLPSLHLFFIDCFSMLA